MLASMAGSRSTPGLPNTAPVPTNQSSVKPFQGGAGKALALNAKTATAASGANRNRKKAAT